MSTKKKSFEKITIPESGENAKSSKNRSAWFNGIFTIFSRIHRWFVKLNEEASKQRELYRKEGSYTVADAVYDDVHAIKTANLPIILILTTPGSPISAIINRIAFTYNFYYLSIGALIRNEISLEVKREDEVHHLLHRGIAIPRTFIFEIIRRHIAVISKSKLYQGFIVTDYPSTLTQTKEFFDYICKPDFILFIKFSERTTRETLHLYLKFQVKASKVLRKLQPDIPVVSVEQAKKFKREVERISHAYSEQFKIINASMQVEAVCQDIMKWVERALVMRNIIPPLFVNSPLKYEPTLSQ